MKENFPQWHTFARTPGTWNTEVWGGKKEKRRWDKRGNLKLSNVIMFYYKV